MTIELVIFIILACVAIFSAAFMLISRNAVHSALFLVVNFLCVAFFYLMLNAPFLAMIQVTVYAGAIMVLFIFVIMLLGSERLSEDNSKYRWLPLGAVVLATIFLAVAFYGVVSGNIGLLKPVPHQPQVRFVNAAAGAPAVNVFLNTNKAADNLNYQQASDFATVPAGDYQVLVFRTCTDANASTCPDPNKANGSPILAAPVKLDPDTTTAYVIAGTLDHLQLIPAPIDLSTVEDETTWRLTAVNAMPGSQPVTLVKRNPDVALNVTPDPKNPDLKLPYEALTPALNYGDVAKPVVLPEGDYQLEWHQGDTRLQPVTPFKDKAKTNELLILTADLPAGQTTPRPAVIRLEPMRTQEAFGSPQQIGQSLLSTFLLPFELVSVLLLAAMVGAIIMTREEVVRRVRQRVVVSPAMQRINAAIPANPKNTEASAD